LYSSLGIYTEYILKERLFLLDKFEFIEALKVYKSKFIIGTGGNLPIPEKVFIIIYKGLNMIRNLYQLHEAMKLYFDK